MPVSDPTSVCVGSGLGQNGSTSKRGACTDCADAAAEREMSATRGSNAFDFIILSRVMTDAVTTDGVILRTLRRAGQSLVRCHPESYVRMTVLVMLLLVPATAN